MSYQIHIKKKTGFTLIELTIVMIIMGIMMAGAIQVFDIYLTQKREAQLKGSLTAVRESLSSFIDTRIRMPCPAPLTAATETAAFGLEQITISGSDISCSGDVSGTNGVFLDDKGNANPLDDVYIGAVPVLTLGLPQEHAFDPFSSRFIYAVTARLAEDNGMINPTLSGAIRVMKGGGSFVDNLQFVLISHGEDAAGSYTAAGVLSASPCDTTIDHMDEENCDMDALFSEQDYALNRGVSDYFDDRVAFSLQGNDDSTGWWAQSTVNATDIYNLNTGNVGIGTTTPTERLSVNGVIFGQSGVVSGDVLLIGNDTKLVDIDIENMTGLYGIQDPSQAHLKLGSAGPVISGVNGNVGIGTINPQAMLDVAGAIRTGGADIPVPDTDCNTNTVGATRYDATSDAMQYCAANVIDTNADGIPDTPDPLWKASVGGGAFQDCRLCQTWFLVNESDEYEAQSTLCSDWLSSVGSIMTPVSHFYGEQMTGITLECR